MGLTGRSVPVLPLTLLAIAPLVLGHEHHDELTEEQAKAPVDAILWIHIFVQMMVWGILFPIGMVLGITRSRWHVPLQSTCFALTAGGYILGHSHKGRMFLPSVHGSFASFLFIPIGVQLALGIYLKLHIHEKTIRPYAVVAHGILGKSYPVLGWTQMLFGALTLQGYCRDGNLGQCLAHYIMGSGFIGYGIIMAILLVAGEAWITRSGRSPEFWDSWVITLWGIVNTFTEHRGAHWSVKDMQHTILGIVWWTGGALGIFLSRNNQRSVIPAVIIILTGWAMSDHAQKLPISTKIHSVFGYTLIFAGVARIIEICFIAPKYSLETLSDDDSHSDHTLADSATASPRFRSSSDKGTGGKTFRHLPPFLLVTAGLLFMSATDEELDFVNDITMDHVTYVLTMFSLAFVIYLHVLFLLHLYSTTGRHANLNTDNNSIEMSDRNKWYSRVPNAEERAPAHVIGEDD